MYLSFSVPELLGAKPLQKSQNSSAIHPSLLECLIQPVSWTGLYLRGSEEEICIFHLHFIYTVAV